MVIIFYKGYSLHKCSYNDQTKPYTSKSKCLHECHMSCMECLHAHISSRSQTSSHMPMSSVTTVTASTNDTRIPIPYRFTSTQCKCQWEINPKSIPTPITQLEVYVLIVCLIFDNITFWITSRVSYTHVPGFSPEGINGSLIALPNTH